MKAIGSLWLLLGMALCSGCGDDSGNPRGRGPCTQNADCDDGIACTTDNCSAATCFHVADHNACERDQICDLRSGCEDAIVCATSADCYDRDECTENLSCSSELRVCLFDLADVDDDGDPAQSCGGTDCDDADENRSGIRPEACNLIDDDCDGSVDEDASDCPSGEVCQDGACACPFDTATDPNNCGSCGHRCRGEAPCNDGLCGIELYGSGCSDEFDCADIDSVCLEDAATGDTLCTIPCSMNCPSGGVCTATPEGRYCILD